MEIISGIILAMTALGGIAYWLTNKKTIRIEEVEDNSIDWEKESYCLVYKIKNTIAACEKSKKECLYQIKELHNNQLDLVEGLGEVSHIAVKNKPLFFEYNNEITKENFFFYERDLNKPKDNLLLTETKNILKEYKEKIDFLVLQKNFFEQLIKSHNQSIDKIRGRNSKATINKKIEKHRKNIANLDSQKIEESAIYNRLLLEDITEKLEGQDEYLKQYLDLKKKYSLNTNNEILEDKIEIEIKEMIKLFKG